MKKINLAISLVVVFGFFINMNNAYSNSDIRLKNLVYENSLGEKGITRFFYSLENKNYKAKWELTDGSRYSINYHFLDENGNLIRKYREFSDSINSNNFYKYDSNGNLLEDYFERSDNVKGIVWYKYEKDKKIEADCRGLNGWFFGIIKYNYKDDLLITASIQKEGKEIGIINYIYDNNGNLIKEFWDFGGNWNQSFNYEYETVKNIIPEYYTYSSPFIKPTKEYLVKEEKYDWNNEKGGPSYYEYEAKKLAEKVYKYDSLETITTYEYYENGSLMKSFRNYSDGRKAEFSYHYNDKQQLIRRLFYLSNGFEGSESYEYNENGTLKRAKWERFDTWLTGTIVFKYHDGNRLKSGLFKGDDDFDANLTFEYDEYKNLNKIHWEFSFGKTQTYWFTYAEY